MWNLNKVRAVESSKNKSKLFFRKSETSAEQFSIKFVYTLFLLSAVFRTKIKCLFGLKINISRWVMFLISVFCLTYHLDINMQFFESQMKSSFSRSSIACILSGILHKFTLCIKIDSLYELLIYVKKTSENLHFTQIKDSKIKWIYPLMFLSISLLIPNIIINSLILYGPNTKSSMFGMIEPPWSAIYILIYTTILSFLFILPINAFAVYYTLVCQELRCLILGFTATIEVSIFNDSFLLLEKFMAIRKLVKHVDENMSLLMLTATLYNACAMFFSISSALHPEDFTTKYFYASVFIRMAASYSGFIGMGISGFMMTEAAEEVGIIAEEYLVSVKKLTSSQKRFLSLTRKELSLTCWKTVNVKRGFLFSTIGTIATYCFLADSLRSK